MQCFLLLASAIVLNSGSSVFYKYSSLHAQDRALSGLLLAAGLGLGVANAVLYTSSLKGIRLNTAYPVFSAGSILLVTAFSLIVFREALSLQKLIGMGLLVLGIAVVAL